MKIVRIGFIPLVDAATLLIAVDKGFTAEEGLDVQLVREASWSNIRDKLAIGLFDAAHLLAPMAVASNLGLGHVKAPLVSPISLAMNGNAITLSRKLFLELQEASDDRLSDPAASARALGKIVRKRAEHGDEPLTFGMTFPFSMHNYELRYWLAEGGIDPDEDVRLVVLPPPYMVESLTRGQIDGFCVGAPWSSLAVDADVGIILHFGCEIFSRAPEKVLAMREAAAADDPDVAAALARAISRAATYVDDPMNRDDVVSVLARPDYIGVGHAAIRGTLAGRINLDSEGGARACEDYLIFGKNNACRPDPRHAVWIYAQMLRWGQARFSTELVEIAKAVYRADLYDAAIGVREVSSQSLPDVVGAFAGPDLDERDLDSYLNGFDIGSKI
ncbi:CmpA/NrtA family ABC transporter substrate-binding protein [Methylocystis sp. Sn-Cys]|uniref:CmpA/NrtA family ABC transporter substrate-binding protein n=1 Tax=Methylocystis sp. Sn-Cys TaxID=1701263 RepID=UPI001923150A|nr:CmpA/NrtA family ABC transporter substrate-binding protein [Methylocystis sp. Sn-Cys]MBL1257665.1 ABC transporter substrate-binding protein [Methylocystis sp. Sn-Cys]